MEARLSYFDNNITAKFAKHINSAGAVLTTSTLPAATQELVKLRASQINGCGMCTDMHTKDALAAGESQQRLNLVAEGRHVNLGAAEGHPALVMDMSFANQALWAEYAVQNAASLERKVYPVPDEIDREIAKLKLATRGIDIDQLTEEQAKYLASWDEGT